MPLRDHFRPPLSRRTSWESFHGGWPMMIVQHLNPKLPECFVAEPRVRIGTYFEIDIGTTADRTGEFANGNGGFARSSNGGVATATMTQAPPEPVLTLEAEIPEQYAYEVLVYDLEFDRQLVAAIEIVSPANKDWPDSRQLFVAKCAGLLQSGVCVSIVDLVTIRQFNLYVELLAMMKKVDPAFAKDPSPAYAATCRKRTVSRRTMLDLTSFAIRIGEPLPTIPIWLDQTRTVTVDLEASYEETCRVLRIA